MDFEAEVVVNETFLSTEHGYGDAPSTEPERGRRLVAVPPDGIDARSHDLLSANEHGSRLPLVLIHGWPEEVGYFDRLATNVGPDQPLYAIPLPSLEAIRSFRGISDWAGYYRARLAELPVGPPYNLFGWSFAGLVTMELADQLGDDAATVCLLDTWYPHNHYSPVDRGVFITNRYLAHARHGRRLTLKYLLEKELHGQRRTVGHIRSHYWALAKERLGLGGPLTESQKIEWLILIRVILRYSAKPVTRPVILVSCRDTERYQGVDPAWDWSRLFVGGFQALHIDGGHFSVWLDEALNVELGDILNRSLVKGRPPRLYGGVGPA
jgi:thioesterase domain-containing protein